MTPSFPEAAERRLRRETLKGLLWWDFQRHREGFLFGLPSIALMAVFLGLVENAGGPMFLWMGLAMSVGCGLGFGRGEWSEGYEEYSLGLPPTRRDRYLVRLSLGFGFLAFLLFVGLAAGPFGWVRAGWELVLTEPPPYDPAGKIWEAFQGNGFYFLTVGVTFATYVECYATSIAAQRVDPYSWGLRLVPFALGSLGLIQLDRVLFPGNVGYLTFSVGVVYGLFRILTGLRRFEQKDAVFDASPSSAGCDGSRRIMVLLAVLAGLGALLIAGIWTNLSRAS